MIDFRLYLVTNGLALKPGSLEIAVHDACTAGARAVQLREKNLDARSLHHLAVELRRITASFKTALFINDRVDIAIAVRADGVHCPENGFPPSIVRRIADEHPQKIESTTAVARGMGGGRTLVGMSAHSINRALGAERSGADFIVFGPVFETASKSKHGKPQGLEKLRDVSKAVRIPVFAIGGVTPDRAELCLKHGAWGVAVVSAVFASANVARAVREFERTLGGL
jgi:thiamine-phosphate pyrophosphorylase